jgi:hypothetical protein
MILKHLGSTDGKWPTRTSAVRQTSDAGYVVAGRTSSFGAGGIDLYVLNTDANGNAPSVPTP